jgi:hypothetical protein
LSKRSRKAARVERKAPVAAQPQTPEVQRDVESPAWTKRWPGWLVLWSGWIIPQIVLLGPAFVGRTVDLPVDLLGSPNSYLPERPEYADVQRHGREVFDMIYLYQEARDFSASELRAGRLPLWQPANYAGAPFAVWPKYSPFELLYYLAPNPITLAWIALLQAITVGLGMWLFLSRCLKLTFWSAALASWCAPLTGFITLWHGSLPLGPVLWLPWSLWAVDGAVKNPWGNRTLAVAIVTALLLLTGHPGMGGLVLLTTGMYFVWTLTIERLLRRQWKAAASSVAGVTMAWLIGFLIGAPYLLPILEYGRTGYRMDLRATGIEERPPEGLEGLPAIFWPGVNGGETHVNTTRTAFHSTLTEGASGAYAGLLAALWLAPLAWCHRRLRPLTIFLILLVILSLGWTLNVPGVVHLLRSRPLRPLASLSFNRWVFATSDAILVLAAIGLDSLLASVPRFRRWWIIPMLAAVGYCGWCVYRLFTLTHDLDNRGFSRCFLLGIALCLAALIGWTTTFRSGSYAKWIRVGVICLLPAELFWFAWSERRQADMALYFPPVPILDKLAASATGRIWGIDCLPPNLNQVVGLEDIRGYDGVDPRNSVKLLDLAINHRFKQTLLAYARTQIAIPVLRWTDRGLKCHSVVDLLNVCYLVYREQPPNGLDVIMHEDDYWIVANRTALPRAFVPRSVRVVKEDAQALAALEHFDLDPRQTAFMTDTLNLPDAMQGEATVRYESPTRTILEANMKTDGLVLLSDSWDPGWRAQLDGTPCPIHRVDVALRGFLVSAGKHQIVCTYDPQIVHIGFLAGAVGCILLVLWTLWKVVARLRPRAGTASVGLPAPS